MIVVSFIIVRVLKILELRMLFRIRLCLFFLIVVRVDVSFGSDVLMVMMVRLIIRLLMFRVWVMVIVFYISRWELIISRISLIII